MTNRLLTVGCVALGLLAARPAEALKLTIAPSEPAIVGQPRSFRVASMAEEVGEVTLRWNFGDGTIETTTAREIAHVYKEAGHYTIIVNADDGVTRGNALLVETVVNPLTPKPPTHSASIILDVERRRLWNVNPDSDTVSIFDQAKMVRDREVPVGREPHALAQAPDKTIWVTNRESDEVVVLNRDTGAIETRIPLPYASQPYGIAFGPGGKAYVSLYATGKLVEIDASSRKVGRELALGPTPAGVTVAHDGRIYVTRFLSPVDHGEVWAIAPQTFQVANTINLKFDPTMDTQSAGRGVPNYVFSMVISPDGTQAWVSSTKANVARGPQRDGKNMTADTFVRVALCKIDMKTETEVFEQRQDIDNRSLPVSVVFSPLGDYGYVLAQASNWIGIIDAYNMDQKGGIKGVGNGPDGLLLAADKKLWVNAFLSRELIAYDMTASLSSVDHAAPEPLVRIPTTDKDRLSKEVLRGKQVFHNSADTRMGHAGYWSCASCHFDGVSDGRIWDFTDRGEGLRNTKTLRGIRGSGHGRIHWSANMDEIQDLERDIRRDFGGEGFMTDAEFNARKGADGHFDTFGKPAAGVNADLDALAAYVTSLDKVDRSPFRNADGSFTKDALAGRELFTNAGCPVCHSGADFTDSAKGNLHDVGTLLRTSAFRLYKPITSFDTPSLKGAWQSAPYYHDGRAATLAEAFTKYNQGDRMGKTSDLSSQQIAQLVAYVEQLDDVPVTEAAAAEEPADGKGAIVSCAVGSAPSRSRGSVPVAGVVLGLLALKTLRRRTRGVARPS